MRKAVCSAALCTALMVFAVTAQPQERAARQIRFVFTSDAHYGLTRAAFRGRANVPAHDVNAALVSDLLTLGPLDFVVEGGDVANRAEAAEHIQPAAASWSQFRQDYLEQIKAPVYVVPGNHDASNAVGYYKTMTPATDATAMIAIYNLMMAPAKRTATTFNYANDRVLTSRDIGGVHFVFLQVWPDSIGRAWLTRNLANVGASTPVVVFTHDQPEAQNKHFINPNGTHDINDVDRFENLLADTDAGTRIAEWESFLLQHPNITAYFHGNSNWNEFYDWRGPHQLVTLHTFRVDSPMKGHDSEQDETKLSFHVASIDTRTHTLTVRERLWNTATWGASATVSLTPPRLTHN